MSPKTAKELFDYNPTTGDLTHRKRSDGWFSAKRFASAWNSRFAGKRAGSVGRSGYIQVAVQGRNLQAHRVVWMIATGEDVSGEIDHINGDKTDNRLSNLRAVTHAENTRNRRLGRNNGSGVNGVGWNSRFGKWQARIKIDGQSKSLGYFDSIDAAAAARKAAEAAHDYHPNHGSER